MLLGLNLFSSLSISTVFKDGAKVRVLIKLEEMMMENKVVQRDICTFYEDCMVQ